MEICRHVEPEFIYFFHQLLLCVSVLLLTCNLHRAGEDYFPHMRKLTEVKRFGMTVMFFSRKEKQGDD